MSRISDSRLIWNEIVFFFVFQTNFVSNSPAINQSKNLREGCASRLYRPNDKSLTIYRPIELYLSALLLRYQHQAHAINYIIIKEEKKKHQSIANTYLRFLRENVFVCIKNRIEFISTPTWFNKYKRNCK